MMLLSQNICMSPHISDDFDVKPPMQFGSQVENISVTLRKGRRASIVRWVGLDLDTPGPLFI